MSEYVKSNKNKAENKILYKTNAFLNSRTSQNMIHWSFFYYTFIHMCIHCLGHFSPLSPSLTLSPLPPSLPGRTCSAFITNFVEEKTQA
jgi:hypothetical protein